MADLHSLSEAIERGDQKSAIALTQDAIEAGIAPSLILDTATGALSRVGARFQAGDIFVPEMLISARAMKGAMAELEPLLTAAGLQPEHTVVLGTIRGDLHDIGKNLVGMMLKGANLAVVDLGTNVTADQFVAAAVEHRASLIGVSALLTTTMAAMHEVVDAVHDAGLTTKVIVGGAPVSEEFAASIGADAYATDAASAVGAAKQILGMS